MCPRYVDNIADIVLQQCDIVSVISRYVPLKKAGRNYKALCPFHGEKTPSFVVSEEKQLFHCFGCGAGGSAIQFVMMAENLEFIEALETLAEQSGLDMRQYETQTSVSSSNSLQPQLMEAVREAAIYYYKVLKNASNEGYAYLEKRGLSHETIKNFGLGFAPEGWNTLLNHLQKKGFSESILEKAGLIIPKNSGKGYYDRFRNRVMFPIQDRRGKVIAFGGRVLDDGVPKYLNSPESPIFDKSKILYGYHIARKHMGDTGQLIMVEGYMDVVSLHQWGIQNVVATLGTAMTDRHAQLVKRSVKEIILAYDSDDAGVKATLRGLEILSTAEVWTRVLQLGESKDPDEYIRANGSEKFKKLIENAIPGTEFILRQIEQRYNLESGYEQLQFLEEAVEVLKKVKNTVEVETYVNQLSERTKKSTESIYGLLKNQRNSQIGIAIKETQNVKQIQKEYIEDLQITAIESKILEAAVGNKTQYNILSKLLDDKWLVSDAVRAIWRHLCLYYEVNEQFQFDQFIDEADFLELKVLHNSTISTVPLDNPERELKVLAERVHVQHLKDLISKEEERVKNNQKGLEKSERESIIKRLYELKKELSSLMAGKI